jgi:hypothetical protein
MKFTKRKNVPLIKTKNPMKTNSKNKNLSNKKRLSKRLLMTSSLWNSIKILKKRTKMLKIKITWIQYSRRELGLRRRKTTNKKYLSFQTNQRQNLKPEGEVDDLENLPLKSKLKIIQWVIF